MAEKRPNDAAAPRQPQSNASAELAVAERRAQMLTEQLQVIMENINGGVSAATLTGGKIGYLFTNDRYYSMFGYTRAQFEAELPNGLVDLIEPEDLPGILTAAARCADERVPADIVYRVHKRDGTPMWVRSCSSVCYIDGVDAPVHLAVTNDITEQRNAYVTLYEADEQLRVLNETAHDLLSQPDCNKGIAETLQKLLSYFSADRAYVFELNHEKRIADNTYEVCAFGVRPEKENLQGVPFDVMSFWIRAFDEDSYIDIPDVSALSEARAKEKAVLQAQGIRSLVAVPLRRDGDVIGFLGIDDPRQQQTRIDRLVAIGDYIAVMLTRRDLNARIESDKKTLESLMNDTPGGFARVKRTGERAAVLLYANDGFCTMLGMTRAQFELRYGLNVLECVHPEDIESLLYTLRDASGGGRSFRARCRLQKGDESYVRLQIFGRLLPNETGETFLNLYLSEVSAQDHLEEQRRMLLENLPGGAGIYHFYPATQTLELVYINDGYYELLDTTRAERERYTGYGVLGPIHPEDVQRVLDEVMTCLREQRGVNVDMRLLSGKGVYKWLNIHAKIVSRSEEKYVLSASYSDIDQLKRTQLQLETRRAAMEIASRSSGISFWTYNIDNGDFTQEFERFSPLGYPRVVKDVPRTFCEDGTVHPDDVPGYEALYEKLFQGDARAEYTFRILNRLTGKYEWQHLYYSRLPQAKGQSHLAVGFSINVDREQENRQRYEHELQLRQEMIRSSVFYYQINLSSRIIEEYHVAFPGAAEVSPGSDADAVFARELSDVASETDEAALQETLSIDALLRGFARGEASARLVYRRRLGSWGLRWVETAITTVARPDTGDIVAFLYCQNIDAAKKDRLAVESIMEEEIESIMVIHAQSGIAHLVQGTDSFGDLVPHEHFDFDEKFRRMIAETVIHNDRAACKGFFSVKKLQEGLAKDPVIKLVYRVRAGDGRTLRKRTRAFYLDDTHEEIILIRRDITDLYEEEQRQKQILQEAVDTANEANRAKSEFLSRMSHDIRTPLNAVIGMAALAREEENPPRTIEYLNNIDTSSHFLLGLINDILDLSRIESGKVELHAEPYSLEALTQSVKTVIQPMMDAKHIDFVFEMAADTACILVDKLRFNQIFFNLLSNAAKFTPEGGRVEFSAVSLPDCEGLHGMRFYVRDNGMGMSAAFLKVLFEPFSQESGAAPEMQGTGLGLAIVKNLVDAMGGTIHVESAPGQGTAFTVDLYAPLSDALECTGKTENASHASLAGLHVLLCEDNAMNVIVAQRLLEHKGCIVDVAQDGRVAVDKFRIAPAGFYDVILMDVRMPVMGGLEAARRIRRLPRPDATVPIIAMTADAFTEDKDRTSEAGMNAHVAKPIDPTLLYATIAAAIARRK
ncbi:MAG: PAS domain-containing protein [Clostridia bacterium]|nr:PAS domain-containing protein [Clostridia bacterium]